MFIARLYTELSLPVRQMISCLLLDKHTPLCFLVINMHLLISTSLWHSVALTLVSVLCALSGDITESLQNIITETFVFDILSNLVEEAIRDSLGSKVVSKRLAAS